MKYTMVKTDYVREANDVEFQSVAELVALQRPVEEEIGKTLQQKTH